MKFSFMPTYIPILIDMCVNLNLSFSFKQQVIEDLAPTDLELNVAAIKEAIEEAKDGFGHWAETSYDREGMLIEHTQLKKENAELRQTVDQLQSTVLYLEAELRSIKQHIGLTYRDVSPPPPPSPSAFENCTGVNMHSSPIGELHGGEYGKFIAYILCFFFFFEKHKYI